MRRFIMCPCILVKTPSSVGTPRSICKGSTVVTKRRGRAGRLAEGLFHAGETNTREVDEERMVAIQSHQRVGNPS